MNDKQIDKWLRRRMSPLGWVLIGYYFLINSLSVAAMVWEALRQFRSAVRHGGDWFRAMDVEALTANGWGYVVAVIVLFVIFYAWQGPGYWRREVLVRKNPMTCGVFLTVLCMCVGSQMINSFWISGLELICNAFDKSLMPLLESVSGDSDTFSMFLYASLLAPLAEELLFRGYILKSLEPYGKKFAIFGSAFLFGLFHGNLLQTPYAFLMGLVLGWVTVEYSVIWAILVHLFNNLVLADLLTRLLKLVPAAVGEGINLILLGSCLAASGVILLVKRGRILEYLRSESMDRRVLKCFFTNAGILILMVLMLGNILLVLP